MVAARRPRLEPLLALELTVLVEKAKTTGLK
jgi:hypothetical protein